MGCGNVGLQLRGGPVLLQDVQGGLEQPRALPHLVLALLFQPVRCTARSTITLTILATLTHQPLGEKACPLLQLLSRYSRSRSSLS